ncbi:MAG: hypothetical protein C4538_05430 [Nitrospiraceae bacterium]|nr:MAG: hypothetical protein C4538_05430 [Nitrospiraceae bacterium]
MYLIEGRKTAEEFIALAWSLEDGTAQFYATVKDMLLDAAAKKVFDSLVRAEEMHKSNLLEAYRLIKGSNNWTEEARQGTLSGIMESGISVSEAIAWVKQPERQPQDILEFSMQLETNSLDLYMKISRETENEGMRKIFNMLIDEEKKHLLRLGNLLNSMYNV